MLESRLRLALQYLIMTTIEAQPVGGKVMFLLSEGPGGAVLREEGGGGFREGPAARTNASAATHSRDHTGGNERADHAWRGPSGISCVNFVQGEDGDRQPGARNRGSVPGVRRR